MKKFLIIVLMSFCLSGCLSPSDKQKMVKAFNLFCYAGYLKGLNDGRDGKDKSHYIKKGRKYCKQLVEESVEWK